MKKHLVLYAAFAVILSACSNTWQGVKADSTENKQHVENAVDKAQDAAAEGWDKTKEATKSGLQKIEQSL